MWDSHTVNRPRAVLITEVKSEKGLVKSLFFNDKFAADASPGNFLMVWIPGVEEVPMNLSRMDRSLQSITVWPYGAGTNALCSMKEGDTIWIRGPYGVPYAIQGRKNLLVGSGSGLAPLYALAKRMGAKKLSATFVLHAKNRDGLIFKKELSEFCNVVAVTSDGSEGGKGASSEIARDMIMDGDFDAVYAGLGEIEQKRIFEAAERKHIPVQFGLERSMLCAIGLCGSCSIGKYLVCKDGPIMRTEQIRECFEEFGVFRRNKSGAIVPVKEY